MADADFGMDRNKMRDLLGTCKRQALNCALGLSKPGAVLLLDKTKSPKTLSMDLQKKFPDLKTPNWGTVSADSADPKMLVFRLEKRTPGMAGKLKLTLKTVGFGKLQIRNADGTVAETTADDDKPDTAISPLAPQPAPAFDPLDPKVMQHAASDAIAAGDEADAWVRAYLRENTLAPNNTDPSGETVQFDNKSIAVATVVSTTVAAGRLAQLKLGGNDHITTERVQRLVTDMLLAAIPHADTGRARPTPGFVLPAIYVYAGDAACAHRRRPHHHRPAGADADRPDHLRISRREPIRPGSVDARPGDLVRR